MGLCLSAFLTSIIYRPDGKPVAGSEAVPEAV
jgi:hypothetical protein